MSSPVSRTAVTGGTLVTEAGVFAATILIDDHGVISGVLSPEVAVTAESVVDAAGLLVFPGGIDTHVHLNDPGLTASEDFFTGTCGAAAGGYTTVFEMPQTVPLVDSVEIFGEKLETVAPKAVVDFCLWSALTPANCRDESALRSVSEAGAIGLKAFFCDTPEMPRSMEADLIVGLKNARDVGLTVAVHCESQAIIDFHTSRLRREGANDVYEVSAARPPESEAEAVRAVLALARVSGGSLHLVHMSDPATIEMAHATKVAGVDVSIETCPQYMTLSREDLKRVSVWGVCAPPLNTPAAVEGMWDALRHGLIDNVASDHCAYKYEEKETDAWRVAPGITGIQVALPAMIDGALKRDVPLSAVARAFSAEPARRFSLSPRKGDIRPGADADLVLVDTASSITARAEDFFTRCPGTAYEDMTFGARIRRTMVRGTSVYVDSDKPSITVDPGFGLFLSGGMATPALRH